MQIKIQFSAFSTTEEENTALSLGLLFVLDLFTHFAKMHDEVSAKTDYEIYKFQSEKERRALNA